jgi:DNA-binding transcriptional MerR regulator
MRSSGTVEDMDIGVVRENTGLSAATLHHYEQLGLIASTGRVGLRRQYNDDIVETLAVIALCQRSGFTLEEIGELMVRRHNAAWKTIARAKLESLDRRIASLQEARDGIQHAINCASPDIMRCEHFRHRIEAIYPI